LIRLDTERTGRDFSLIYVLADLNGNSAKGRTEDTGKVAFLTAFVATATELQIGQVITGQGLRPEWRDDQIQQFHLRPTRFCLIESSSRKGCPRSGVW
jgi:hypothetical protein